MHECNARAVNLCSYS